MSNLSLKRLEDFKNHQETRTPALYPNLTPNPHETAVSRTPSLYPTLVPNQHKTVVHAIKHVNHTTHHHVHHVTQHQDLKNNTKKHIGTKNDSEKNEDSDDEDSTVSLAKKAEAYNKARKAKYVRAPEVATNSKGEVVTMDSLKKRGIVTGINNRDIKKSAEIWGPTKIPLEEIKKLAVDVNMLQMLKIDALRVICKQLDIQIDPKDSKAVLVKTLLVWMELEKAEREGGDKKGKASTSDSDSGSDSDDNGGYETASDGETTPGKESPSPPPSKARGSGKTLKDLRKVSEDKNNKSTTMDKGKKALESNPGDHIYISPDGLPFNTGVLSGAITKESAQKIGKLEAYYKGALRKTDKLYFNYFLMDGTGLWEYDKTKGKNQNNTKIPSFDDFLRSITYVGKGIGDRASHYFEVASRPGVWEHDAPKIQRIIDLWLDEKPYYLLIMKDKMMEYESFDREEALIEGLCKAGRVSDVSRKKKGAVEKESGYFKTPLDNRMKGTKYFTDRVAPTLNLRKNGKDLGLWDDENNLDYAKYILKKAYADFIEDETWNRPIYPYGQYGVIRDLQQEKLNEKAKKNASPASSPSSSPVAVPKPNTASSPSFSPSFSTKGPSIGNNKPIGSCRAYNNLGLELFELETRRFIASRMGNQHHY